MLESLTAQRAARNGAPRWVEKTPRHLEVPELITDTSGRARLEIPLADSITTWRLTAQAVTSAGAIGSTSVSVYEPSASSKPSKSASWPRTETACA